MLLPPELKKAMHAICAEDIILYQTFAIIALVAVAVIVVLLITKWSK